VVEEDVVSPPETLGVEEDSEVSELLFGVISDVEVDPVLSDKERFELWKTGNVDFMGEDQFAKIQSRIDSVINVAIPTPESSLVSIT